MQPGESYNQSRLIQDVYLPGESPKPSLTAHYLVTPIGKLYDIWSHRYRPDEQRAGRPAAQPQGGEMLLGVYTPPGILEAWPMQSDSLLRAGMHWADIYTQYVSARITPALKGIASAAAGVVSDLIARFQTLQLTIPFRAASPAATTSVPLKYSRLHGVSFDWQAMPYYRVRKVILPIVLLLCGGVLALIVWLSPQPHAAHQPLPHISIIPFPPPNPPGLMLSKTAFIATPIFIPGVSAPFISPVTTHTLSVSSPGLPTLPINKISVNLPATTPPIVSAVTPPVPVGQTVQTVTQQVNQTSQTVEQTIQSVPPAVTQTVTNPTQPVIQQVAPVTQTVTKSVPLNTPPLPSVAQPITPPVTQVTPLVTQPVAQKLPSVPAAVAPVAKQATQPLIDIVKPVTQTVTQPLTKVPPTLATVPRVAPVVAPTTQTVTTPVTQSIPVATQTASSVPQPAANNSSVAPASTPVSTPLNTKL